MLRTFPKSIVAREQPIAASRFRDGQVKRIERRQSHLLQRAAAFDDRLRKENRPDGPLLPRATTARTSRSGPALFSYDRTDDQTNSSISCSIRSSTHSDRLLAHAFLCGIIERTLESTQIEIQPHAFGAPRALRGLLFD